MDLSTLVAENMQLAAQTHNANLDGQHDAAKRLLATSLSLLSENAALFGIVGDPQPPATPPADSPAEQS